jgi:hypothetical protein
MVIEYPSSMSVFPFIGMAPSYGVKIRFNCNALGNLENQLRKRQEPDRNQELNFPLESENQICFSLSSTILIL